MKKQYKYALIISATCLFLLGWWILSILPQLLVGASFGPRFYPSTGKTEYRVIVSDVDPQVIYRIDQHRYLTLENYISCDQAGEVYYLDDKKGIKTHVSGDSWVRHKDIKVWLLGYRGIIINPVENGIIGFPYAPTDFCSEHGCDVAVNISTDGGKTFKTRYYNSYSSASEHTKNEIIIIKKNRFFMKDSYGIHEFPFDINQRGRYRIKHLPQNVSTPSGDTHYYCDNRIKPRSVKFIHPETGREEQ